MTKIRINIRGIPHKIQRYPTCGDYYVHEGALRINISKLEDKREMLLVAIHELVEWALLDGRIPLDQIDAFDRHWSGAGEPGDDPQAPYYKEHQLATGIERILAAELGVDWLTYERHLAELEYNSPVDPFDPEDVVPLGGSDV